MKDYSCSCAEGNSYKGMCAHGEALFAYYEDYAERSRVKASGPHTSQEVHTMIREYTNRQVSRIMAAEEAEKADLVPVLPIVRPAGAARSSRWAGTGIIW